MIHEIKVKNCLSFREEQTLSFEATADKTYEEYYCVEVRPGLKLLKLGVLYGPNGSGKTNLLSAIEFLRETALTAKTDKHEEINFSPFLLDNHSQDSDGEISISFFHEGMRFIYELHINTEYISTESLTYYPGSQAAVLYKAYHDAHSRVKKIEFGPKLGLSKKEKIILEGNAIGNSSLLSVYMKSNVSNTLLDMVTGWFKNSMMSGIHPGASLTQWAQDQLQEDGNPNCKKLTLEMLNKADFNIIDMLVKESEKELDEDTMTLIARMDFLTEDAREQILEERKLRRKEIFVVHKTEEGMFALPFDLQSQGTKRYFGLAAVLNALIEESKCLFIDELESSLHYELFNYFIRTFLANSSNSQLFFTTHNVSLLMDDFIRRDVVWFCEKKPSGASELYSASDFRLHKNLSLFNAYRSGKLGAKPDIGDIFMETHG